MIRLQVGTEFSSSLPLSRPYAQCFGLRCLARVTAAVRQSKDAQFSHLPSLESTLRRLDDATAAFAEVSHSLQPHDASSQGHELRAAHDALAAWEDVSVGDVAQYQWGRALQHKSCGMTLTHSFLPPLPTPAVGLDKYVAFVVSALVASTTFVRLPYSATQAFDKGLNRTASGKPTNADGSLRLAADSDRGSLSSWWPSSSSNAVSQKKSGHFLLLVNGAVFSVDLTTRSGLDLSMSELSSVITAVFIASQNSNARNTFTRCSTLSTDNLSDATMEQVALGKLAYSALRCEVSQLPAHERQLELLETARFVVSVDSSLSMQCVLQDREVGSPNPPRSTYPSINRWSHNALNVCIDAAGAIELCVPTCIAAATDPSEPQAPWLERLGTFLTNRCIVFDELASEEYGHAITQMFLIQRCVWATGVVFRVVSNTPGKTCACLVLEQLAQYTGELQRLVPDEEERGALEVAHRVFTGMVRPAKGAESLAHAIQMMKLYFEECKPFFSVVQHPVIRGPLLVEAVDVDHTSQLTRALVNPLVTMEMKEVDGSTVSNPVMRVMELLPPGTVKLIQLDALEGFVSLTVDAPHFERIDFFSHLPSKEQRAEAIAAAGTIGFHIVHAQQALAAVEEAAKKSFQRLLYAHENSLDRHDPWKKSYRLTFSEEVSGVPRQPSTAVATATTSDTVVVSSEEVFKFSRRISRFVIHNVPRMEDEALQLRFAHPASIVKAVAALAAQFALLHVQMPLQPTATEELTHLICAIKAWDGVERLVGGDAISLKDVFLLYQSYFLPVLCGSGKTAPLPKHRAVQLCAHAILRLVEHLFEPVEAPHHLAWVGAVHRNRVVGDAAAGTVPIDVLTYATKLPRHPPRHEIPWQQHLDALDCCSRCAPLHAESTPCVLTPLQSSIAKALRAPNLGVSFLPTEAVEVVTGDDVRSTLHSARARRSHLLDQPLTTTFTPTHTTTRSLPTRLRMHVLVVKSQRFIDKKTLEDVRLDIRGVWSSDAFEQGFLESFQRCYDMLWAMWSVDNLELAGHAE